MHVLGLNESGGHSNERVKVSFFVEHDNSLTFQCKMFVDTHILYRMVQNTDATNVNITH